MIWSGAPDRRSLSFGLFAAAAAGSQWPWPAAAQLAGAEIIVAGPPGDGQDQLARAVAEGLGTTRMTPRMLPVNLPHEFDALREFAAGKRPRAALMVVGLSTVGALTLERQIVRLDGCRPLARVIGEQLPIAVNAASPFRTASDLMDALRRDVTRVSFAGRGRGGADHQLAVALARAAGADPRRLDYKACGTSAEASTLVLRGDVKVATGALWEFRQQIVGGSLRALALASPERAEGLDVPTLAEQGIDVQAINWRGLVSRDAIGAEIVARYGEAMQILSEASGWKTLLKNRQWLNLYQPQAEFTRFLTQERERVATLLTGLPPS